MASTSNQNEFKCEHCDRVLKSKGGKTLHQNKCFHKNSQDLQTSVEAVVLSSNTTTDNSSDVKNHDIPPDPPDPPVQEKEANPMPTYKWGEYDNFSFEKSLNFIYEKIVFWRKNLFLLPTGGAGKWYIDEITRLINEWLSNSPLKSIAFKLIMIMPNLLLQKPSKNSKAKDHLAALERRRELWQKGHLKSLFEEAKTIQNTLPSLQKPKTQEELRKKFVKVMRKGNINAAIKLLTNSMQNGVVPLSEETLQLLKMKHPEEVPASPDILFKDEPVAIHPITFEKIDAELVRTAARKTQGGSGPSGMDADGWRKLLVSNSFGKSSSDLCQAIADLCKRLCIEVQDNTSLEAFLACRLIPLDKNPGIRPIGIGEILRRIVGKTIVWSMKGEIIASVGALQTCAGHEAGCEALVHAMHQIFQDEEIEAVFMIDAENAFNSVNRNVFLHNIKVVCPQIATFVTNCYQRPSRLFVLGGIEIRSKEGTTQGDPIAMAIYAIALIPLIYKLIAALKDENTSIKNAAYADDLSAAGSITALFKWWNHLCIIGPKFGYYPRPDKCWLIVKEKEVEKAREIFKPTKVNITTKGRKHLGAVIGSNEYKDNYVSEKIDNFVNQLRSLTEIAKFEPQCAYACLTKGLLSKLTYVMRTIPEIQHHLQRIDNIILTEFLPTLFGGKQISDLERRIMALPVRLGGLGIPILAEITGQEYSNSKFASSDLVNSIISQDNAWNYNNENGKCKKKRIHLAKRSHQQDQWRSLREKMSNDQRKLNDLACEDGASLWLTTIPLEDEGYSLTKQQFRDLVSLRYGWQLSRMPEKCECGSRFTVDHALSCKKGGFISLRHNILRNITSSLLAEVCKDVCVEPLLTPITGENLPRSANTSNEARADISARGFWETGQVAFFDLRVFNPMATRYVDQDLSKSFEVNEKEKKRAYNERIQNIEHGTFTPLVFACTGGMGRECKKFYARLAEAIAKKRKTRYSSCVTWVRRKIIFSLIKSITTCIRGSRQHNKCFIDQSMNNNILTSEIRSSNRNFI